MVLALVAGGSTAALAVEEVHFSPRPLTRNTAAVDAALAAGAVRIESTAIASLKSRDASLARLESAWTWQGEDSPLRVRLGDTTSNPGAWGSAVRFAGLQFGTPFEMRPDLLHAPRLALSGLAVVPTAADALLGAARAPAAGMAERGLSTGRPAPGANGIAITAYDAAGRSTAMNRALIAAPRAVDEGCRSYSLSLGRVRENYGLVETGYGAWFANTTFACGLGGGRSVEAHGEFLAGDAALAGLTFTQPAGALGRASLAAAASEHGAGNGYALQMGLQRELDRIALGLQARMQSADYRDLGRQEASDAIAQRMLASIATRFNDRSTLALAYAMQRTWSAERTDVLGLTQTLKFRSGGSLSLGAQHALDDAAYSSVNVSFARALSY